MRIGGGRSIFQGGKDHSSHRLALLGFKRYKTVLFIYGVCIFLGIIAITISKVNFGIGLGLILLALMAMIALGIRLSFVDTKSFGRKKKSNGII